MREENLIFLHIIFPGLGREMGFNICLLKEWVSKWKTMSQCVIWGTFPVLPPCITTADPICKHYLPWLSNTFLHFLQPFKLGQLEEFSTGQSWDNMNVNENNNVNGLNTLNMIKFIIQSVNRKIPKQNFICDLRKSLGNQLFKNW